MSGPNSILIHELRHRLQTLEVDLREAAQAQVITEHDFHVRIKRVERSVIQAQKLLSVTSAQTLPTEIPSQVDLPVMSDASRLEQKIVSRFVKDTKAYTRELAAKVRRTTDLANDASEGTSGWFKAMFRLSWLKSQIRRADQDLESVRRARVVIEDFISKSEISGNDPNPRKNQRDLLAAFQEFEAATGRVTSMRARLRGEIAKNNELRQWLEQYAIIRRQNAEGQLPPEPEKFNEAFKAAAERLTSAAKLAKERLVIARQLAAALGDSVEAKKQESNIVATSNILETVNGPQPLAATTAKLGGRKTKKNRPMSGPSDTKGVSL